MLYLSKRFQLASLLPLSLCVILGCSSGPPALSPPDLDPQSAADEAMALYDKNGDTNLSGDELLACPGLLKAKSAYDTNSDDAISRDEIAARLQQFVDRDTALTGMLATVTLDGKPLEGATVKLIPEPYLGDAIKPASGKTQKRGAGRISIAAEDLPANQKEIRGIHFGTYRVEITHPQIEVPSQFNSATTLGFETQPGNSSYRFDLKSK